MAKRLRLDKYLADMGIGTRSETKDYIRRGRVCVNGETIRTGDMKINCDEDLVTFDQKPVGYVGQEYYMLNKPAGVVSSTSDKFFKTVVDLIENPARKDLFPVGRLDKDTEGLLLITNDGALAHKLLSPKKHVGKVYYAEVSGCVTMEDVKQFSEGLKLEEGFTTLPAELKIIESDAISKIELTIYEGKFHQVKRMFEAVDKKVIYLKRLSMGDLVLDSKLAAGQYRALTEEELFLLKQGSEEEHVKRDKSSYL